MRAGLTSFVMLALVGCTGAELRTLDLTQDSGVVVVILLDAEGLPTRSLDPFGLDEGRLTFGQAPRVQLREGETRAVWLRLDPSQWQATLPRLDLARLPELKVKVAAPPRPPQYEPLPNDLGIRATLELPSAGVQAFDEAGARVDHGFLQSTLTLEVWLDGRACAEPGRSELRPYALNDLPFTMPPPGERQDGILSLAALDSPYLLVGGAGVVLISRDTLFLPASGRYIAPEHLRNLGFDEARITGLARAEDAAHPGRVFATLSHNGGGALLELRVIPAALGVMEVVRTATVVESALFRISRDLDGTLAVAGDEGLVLILDADADNARRLPLPGGEYAGFATSQLIWTEDPNEPLIANSLVAMHGLNRSRDTWSTTPFMSGGFGVRFRGLARHRGQIWAASNKNTFYQRLGPGAYQSVSPRMDPAMRACGTGEIETFPVVLRHVDTIAADDDALFFAYDECSIAVRLRGDDLCASSILPPAGTPSVVSWDYTASLVHEGALILGTSEGELWVSDPGN